MNFKNLFSKSTPFIIGIACALIITGWLPRVKQYFSDTQSTNTEYQNIIKANSFAHIISPVLPSVVSIYSTATHTPRKQVPFDDSLFQQQFNTQSERKIKRSSSLGSGVILHRDGYILTNYHVIKDADQIVITLSDGRETIAEIIGIDIETDLAVLKIQLSGVTPIKIEQNVEPNIGDLVFTIANPFGVGQSVSMGILSATGRDQIGLAKHENYLQTDAAIHPGSSGGALINAHGNLIGLNTAIVSNSGGNQGVGFAIPNSISINNAIQMIENGRVTRGYLGVLNTTLLSVSEAQELGIDFYALRINYLFQNGPAQKAGILQGDILTHINGEPFLNPNNVARKITKHAPGTAIDVRILRNTEIFDMKIVLGTSPK